jgi:hypothetical protein
MRDLVYADFGNIVLMLPILERICDYFRTLRVYLIKPVVMVLLIWTGWLPEA